MTPAELQRWNQVIAFIEQVQVKELIDDMLRMLKLHFEQDFYVTSELESAGIIEAKEEIADGKGIEAEDVEREKSFGNYYEFASIWEPILSISKP